MDMGLISSKYDAFEYQLDKLIGWHNDINGKKNEIPNDFTILKIIKLNFFTSAVSSTPTKMGLLQVFNNFHAMPLGPVESDIYNNLHRDNRYVFNGYNLENKPDPKEISLDSETKAEIDKSIDLLKRINPDLVKYPPRLLVEISHKWNSWKSTFNHAKLLDKHSFPIPTELIQNDIKYFYL